MVHWVLKLLLLLFLLVLFLLFLLLLLCEGLAICTTDPGVLSG